MTSLSRVSILTEVVNLLRGGNISTCIECRASSGEAGMGDSQHLLGGDPTDDYGKDRGLLRDGLEQEGDGGGEDEYETIYSSTRARVDGGRGGSLKGSDSEPMAGVGRGIDNLTMEQYLALTRENQALGMVKPEIGGNVNFKIKSQFMRELREDTFFGNKNDDAHEHVEQVVDIVSLFNIPGISHNLVMLRVFPITLLCWVDRLPPGTVKFWDLFKKALI
uniref:Reverse transcriptase domain-containing protein n=1 Tax=Tanacetum cinerariifolium TaxID=118510 RepID=A0A6L2L1Q8_TANCI|nr:hypothetical protein [Tanacetum cinerariifolium]